jgi:hypothetical protein
VPETLSPYATWEYSWIRPPSRSRRRTRIPVRRMRAPRRRVLVQCPVRAVAVMVTDVLAEDQPQVPFAGDQHLVQALAAGAADPAFGYSVGRHRQLHPIQMIGTSVSG